MLVSFWSSAVSALHPDPGRSKRLLGDASSDASSPEDDQAVFDRGLHRLVGALTAHGKAVVIVASVPEIGADVPESLARMAQGRGRDPAPTRAAYLDRQAPVFATFRSLARRYGTTIVYPHDILCGGERCRIASDGRPLYVDAGHLNANGVLELRPLFSGLF